MIRVYSEKSTGKRRFAFLVLIFDTMVEPAADPFISQN